MLPVVQGEAAPPPGAPGAPALAALLCAAEVTGDSYLPGYFSPFSSLLPNSDSSQDEDARLVSELQLGDSWGGVQGKMSVAAPVKKIRKKSDNKPQSQINKCNNEKRRRELENETINQLEELLGACLSDLKQPDKNGIVQEAAQQIRQVLERRRLGANTSCNSCLPLQHGDVSSTHPSHHSEIAALLESVKHFTNALGWVLLEISVEATIECVTENIREIAGWDRSELVKQSLYNYLYYGDHHKLLPILQGASELDIMRAHSGRLQSTRTRLLVKPTPDGDGNGGESERRYVDVLLSACLVREVECGTSVLCLIRRQEEPTPAQGPPPRPMHQITFKLDTNAKILLMEGANVTGIEGRRIHELIHPSDIGRVSEHLQSALNAGGVPQALSGPPPRLRLAPHLPYIAARPHSRLFNRNPTSNEPEFMMTTFTIVSEVEMSVLESSNNNNNNSTSQNPPVGGPLMTSAVVNGNGPRNGQCPQSPTSETFALLEDYFPGGNTWPERNSPSVGFCSFPFSPLVPTEDPKMEEKPNISGSGPPTPHTPSSTPLPPPTAPTPPSHLPEPESGRLRNLLSNIKRESPASTPTPEHHHTAPNTPNPPTTPLGPHSAGNNLILKTLLKEEEEDPQRSGQPDTPTSIHNSMQHNNRTQSNNMLLKLLNDKSDEEDPEQRNNRNNRSELLSQLLKEGSSSNNSSTNSNMNMNSNSSYSNSGGNTPSSTNAGVQALQSQLGLNTPSSGEELLQFLGHGGQKSALKRKLMQEEQMLKRPLSIDPHQVSSSNLGHSKLREKNKILTSLLEKTPSQLTTPVPLPIPHLNQRPYPRPTLPPHHTQLHPALLHQQRPSQALANLLNNKKDGGVYDGSNNNCPMTNANTISMSGSGVVTSGGGMPNNTGPSPLQQILQGPNRVQYSDGSSDPVLSNLLDEVMDIVYQEQPDINLIPMETPSPAAQPGPNAQHHHNLLPANQAEKMAINRIQESLMQYETAVKSPSSPGVPPAYTSAQGMSSGWVYSVSRQKSQLAVQQAQQKARLLQQQQQQMVVEGGTPSTPTPSHHVQSMDALLNAPTPPNVSLQRATDAPPYTQQPPPQYHHHHHLGSGGGGFPPGPDTPPYKLTMQQQQNPMLNAQLTQSGYSGQRVSPLAPHTPLTPYPPPPRGGLQRHHSHPAQHSPAMQGYYMGGEGGLAYEGGGSMFLSPPPHPHPHQHHINNHNMISGTMTSEFVRQELRAVVGARTGGGGGGGGARPPDHMQPPPPDLESLGLTFEMPSSGGAGTLQGGGTQHTTLWDSTHHHNSNTNTSTMEEVRGGDHKSSLLQKLLSE